MEYRWHIFLADLDPVIGSEQGKTRPVLVISEEEINQILPVVNVLPLRSYKYGISKVRIEVTKLIYRNYDIFNYKGNMIKRDNKISGGISERT